MSNWYNIKEVPCDFGKERILIEFTSVEIRNWFMELGHYVGTNPIAQAGSGCFAVNCPPKIAALFKLQWGGSQ